ncbi:GAF and ANTAR domain-containing protein [Kineococcus sp. SYSU DK004]|uniref:GAF and ANTAR domain-containing protein n=1 Tax=Kineococcus sp. SYSU DK004 TaxID=3383125 RepID=UPI003D7E0AFA
MDVDARVGVAHAFVDLADSLAAGYDAYDLLQRLVEHCARLLDVSAVGLLLADAQGRLQVAASSSEEVHLLELFQLQTGGGPCVESCATGAVVRAGTDEEQRRRWPAFAGAMHAHGFHGVAALPLRLREQSLGTLGLFTERPHAPGDADVAVAQGLADVTSIALLQARAVGDAQRVTRQLQTALDSRVLVEQAKGIVATQRGTGVREAFALLRTHARNHHVPLSALAGDVVAGRLHGRELRTTPTPAARRDGS